MNALDEIIKKVIFKNYSDAISRSNIKEKLVENSTIHI